ncbi:MAG: class I SAM-dependent methyltransferase [bacterium]|nr:class I SAM-dependent methyltransferase [Candidatus Sumerlaeota bacterium]
MKPGGERAAFARKINRQRLQPRMYDFSYLLLRKNLIVFGNFARMVNTVAGEKNDVRVLDIGCGFEPWRELMPPSCRYTGIDYNVENASPECLGSALHIPARASVFDAVICSEVLEHTRNPDQVVNEIRRVVKPGGLVFLSSPFFFPVHGAPYDFQRLTRFFYLNAFAHDSIICLTESNSSLATGVTSMNLAIESGPFRLFIGLTHLFYIVTNLIGLCIDALSDAIGPRIMRSYRDYFYRMPLGYAMIIRINK